MIANYNQNSKLPTTQDHRQTSQNNKQNSDKTPIKVFNIGCDTEYTTYKETEIVNGKEVEREYQNCVTLQLAIAGKVENLDHPDLINTQVLEDYQTFIFKPPVEKLLGVDFVKWQESIVLSVLEKLLDNLEDKIEVNLIAFYSNAELAHIIPNRKHIQQIIQEKESNNLPDPKLLPIQSTGNFMDISINTPSNIKINIRDARLISAGGSLAQLGESLGFNKGDLDFEKHHAKYYLENETDKFFDYAGRDAIIPLKWFNLFHDTGCEIRHNLTDKLIISEKDCERLNNKVYHTAASVTDDLMKANLTENGKYKKYKDSVEYLGDYVIPRKFSNLNKGGLNKSSHGFIPEIIPQIDGYDIKSAYLNSIKSIQIPIRKPTLNKTFNDGDGCIFTWKELARYLDKYPYSFVICDEVYLGDNVPENKRILNMYTKEGECCTSLSNSAIPQMFTGFELQAQALALGKNSNKNNGYIKVNRIIAWNKKFFNNPNNYHCFDELFSELQDVRKEFKNEYGSKSPQQDVAKLLANAGVGKLAQNKEGFDPNYLMDVLHQGGDVNSIVKNSFKSHCYNPFAFNFVTGLVRAVTGLSYALSDGVMCVTDSVFCPSGKFKSSKEISNLIKDKKINGDRYQILEKMLANFDWELEHENCNLQIFKERDYAIIDGDDKDIGQYSRNIKMGKATAEDLENIEIRKVAKRGYKQNDKQPKRTKQEEFLLLGNLRFSGKPIRQKHKRLNKLNDMLTGSLNLNQAYLNGQNSAGMGSYNLKYLCDSLEELNRRRKVKGICRTNGYADQFHVQMDSPDKLLEFEKKALCRQNGNYKDILNGDQRRLLAVAQHLKIFSCRQLEKITGISRSTLNRLKLNLEKTKLAIKFTNEVLTTMVENSNIAGIKKAVEDLANEIRLNFAVGDSPNIIIETP